MITLDIITISTLIDSEGELTSLYPDYRYEDICICVWEDKTSLLSIRNISIYPVLYGSLKSYRSYIPSDGYGFLLMLYVNNEGLLDYLRVDLYSLIGPSILQEGNKYKAYCCSIGNMVRNSIDMGYLDLLVKLGWSRREVDYDWAYVDLNTTRRSNEVEPYIYDGYLDFNCGGYRYTWGVSEDIELMKGIYPFIGLVIDNRESRDVVIINMDNNEWININHLIVNDLGPWALKYKHSCHKFIFSLISKEVIRLSSLK